MNAEHDRVTCAAAGRVVHRRERARPVRAARPHAERRAAERRGRPRLPAARQATRSSCACSIGAPTDPITATFRYIGITNEFPTAPKDAYTIVNAAYVARVTHDPGVGSFLIQTSGASPGAVGSRAAAVGASGTVTDIDTNHKLIAGSLTSVELAGLTRVELAYALVLVAAATGLLLWLGIAERRRTFAIASALGARPRQLGGFIWTETAFVTIGGVAARRRGRRAG